jgi:hypothetical protein
MSLSIPLWNIIGSLALAALADPTQAYQWREEACRRSGRDPKPQSHRTGPCVSKTECEPSRSHLRPRALVAAPRRRQGVHCGENNTTRTTIRDSRHERNHRKILTRWLRHARADGRLRSAPPRATSASVRTIWGARAKPIRHTRRIDPRCAHGVVTRSFVECCDP